MASYNVFTHLPRLEIDPENVSASFKKWYKKYELAARLATINMGTEKVDGENVPRFRGETKLLALLNAIGNDGIEVLESRGFDLNSKTEEDYEVAVEHLKNYYDKGENIHVAWVKAASLSQNCGESEVEFLLRVEKQSRCLGFVNGANIEELRQRFATSMALVGLRDESVREKLMMDDKLSWKSLSDTLKTRSIAKDSSQKLTEARSGNLSSGTNNGSGSKNTDSGSTAASVNRLTADKRNSYSSGDRNSDRNHGSSNDRQRSMSRGRSGSRNSYRNFSRDRYRNSSGNSRGYSADRYRNKSGDRYSNNSRDTYNNNNGSRNGSRNNSRERYRQPSVDRRRSNEVNESYSRHKSPDYRGSSSHEIVCYYCHRPGHIAMECPDIRCYACGRRGHTANNCDVNRPRRDSVGNNGRYSPGRYSPGRGSSSQFNDARNSSHHEIRSSYNNNDKRNSQDNEEKSSAVRFTNSS